MDLVDDGRYALFMFVEVVEISQCTLQVLFAGWL